MQLRRIATGLTLAAVLVPLTTMVSHSFGRTAYPLLLPAIKDDLGLSNSQAGTASTTLFAAYVLGVLAVTVTSSRFGPTTILRAGLAISAFGLALLSFASALPMLIIGLALTSAGGAGIWITAPVLATANIAPQKRGIVIGFLTGSIGFANSTIALSTTAARNYTGNDELWQPMYVGMLVATLIIAAVILLFIDPDETPTPNADPAPSSDARPASFAARAGFTLDSLHVLPGWKPITIGYMSFGIIAAGYGNFLAEALEENGGLSRDTVSLLYVGLGFGSLLGAPLLGWLSDRTSRKSALISVLVIMALTCSAVALATGWLLIVTVACFGGIWASYPTLTATYIRDHLDQKQFGQAYGTMTIFFSIAAVPSPWVTGRIADSRGSFTIPYLLFALIAVCGIAVLSRAPSSRGRTS